MTIHEREHNKEIDELFAIIRTFYYEVDDEDPLALYRLATYNDEAADRLLEARHRLDLLFKVLERTLNEFKAATSTFKYSPFVNKFRVLLHQFLKLYVDLQTNYKTDLFNKDILELETTIIQYFGINQFKEDRSYNLKRTRKKKMNLVNRTTQTLLIELLTKHKILNLDWSYTTDHNALISVILGGVEKKEIQKVKNKALRIIDKKLTEAQRPQHVKGIRLLKDTIEHSFQFDERFEPVLNEINSILEYLEKGGNP